MDMDRLRANAHRVLDDATIPELPNHYRGKVRDNYDLADGSRVIIATDRISAFDRILAAIPFKGEVLTQTARYWFEETADICPNHVIAYPDPNVVVGRRLDILPVEIVVRDYLAGTTGTSVLTLYKKGQREMYGITLPDGLRDNQRLPQPIITPTSKAFDGGHDEPLSPGEILDQKLVTPEQWRTLTDYAFALFARGQKLAAERGLIMVDTKYEFGTDSDGRIVLADEIHTPDSSRYWVAATYTPGGDEPENMDKEFLRKWFAAQGYTGEGTPPRLTPAFTAEVAARYITTYEKLTGQAFVPARLPAADRIRRAMDAYAQT